jgi:hypothetical protein
VQASSITPPLRGSRRGGEACLRTGGGSTRRPVRKVQHAGGTPALPGEAFSHRSAPSAESGPTLPLSMPETLPVSMPIGTNACAKFNRMLHGSIQSLFTLHQSPIAPCASGAGQIHWLMGVEGARARLPSPAERKSCEASTSWWSRWLFPLGPD